MASQDASASSTQPVQLRLASNNKFHNTFMMQHDAYLIRLKQAQAGTWKEIAKLFNARFPPKKGCALRTSGGLQVRFSRNIKANLARAKNYYDQALDELDAGVDPDTSNESDDGLVTPKPSNRSPANASPKDAEGLYSSDDESDKTSSPRKKFKLPVKKGQDADDQSPKDAEGLDSPDDEVVEKSPPRKKSKLPSGKANLPTISTPDDEDVEHTAVPEQSTAGEIARRGSSKSEPVSRKRKQSSKAADASKDVKVNKATGTPEVIRKTIKPVTRTSERNKISTIDPTRQHPNGERIIQEVYSSSKRRAALQANPEPIAIYSTEVAKAKNKAHLQDLADAEEAALARSEMTVGDESDAPLPHYTLKIPSAEQLALIKQGKKRARVEFGTSVQDPVPPMTEAPCQKRVTYSNGLASNITINYPPDPVIKQKSSWRPATQAQLEEMANDPSTPKMFTNPSAHRLIEYNTVSDSFRTRARLAGDPKQYPSNLVTLDEEQPASKRARRDPQNTSKEMSVSYLLNEPEQNVAPAASAKPAPIKRAFGNEWPSAPKLTTDADFVEDMINFGQGGALSKMKNVLGNSKAGEAEQPVYNEKKSALSGTTREELADDVANALTDAHRLEEELALVEENASPDEDYEEMEVRQQ